MTWEDQQRINTFGRINNRKHEIEDEIVAKKKVAEDLEDAENELILTDEEEIRVLTGEVFIHTPRDNVEELLTKLADKNKHELQVLEQEKGKIVEKLSDLKRILYGKFKDQINLEEE